MIQKIETTNTRDAIFILEKNIEFLYENATGGFIPIGNFVIDTEGGELIVDENFGVLPEVIDDYYYMVIEKNSKPSNFTKIRVYSSYIKINVYDIRHYEPVPYPTEKYPLEISIYAIRKGDDVAPVIDDDIIIT